MPALLRVRAQKSADRIVQVPVPDGAHHVIRAWKLNEYRSGDLRVAYCASPRGTLRDVETTFAAPADLRIEKLGHVH